MEATTVLPSSARSFRVCITRCAWNESSPLVGSSASHPHLIALWLIVNAPIAFSIGYRCLADATAQLALLPYSFSCAHAEWHAVTTLFQFGIGFLRFTVLLLTARQLAASMRGALTRSTAVDCLRQSGLSRTPVDEKVTARQLGCFDARCPDAEHGSRLLAAERTQPHTGR